jgi:hypothetical protein
MPDSLFFSQTQHRSPFSDTAVVFPYLQKKKHKQCVRKARRWKN